MLRAGAKPAGAKVIVLTNYAIPQFRDRSVALGADFFFTVRTIEERLDKMQYFVGAVDDRFDDDTASGVMAFQKVQGLSADAATDAEITTLGRGGSDTTAVALAGRLQAVVRQRTRLVNQLHQLLARTWQSY